MVSVAQLLAQHLRHVADGRANLQNGKMKSTAASSEQVLFESSRSLVFRSVLSPLSPSTHKSCVSIRQCQCFKNEFESILHVCIDVIFSALDATIDTNIDVDAKCEWTFSV